MNKKLLTLFTFLMAITMVSHTASALSFMPTGKMMSPEAFCSLDAKLLFRGAKGESVSKYQRLLSYYFEKNPQESLVALPELVADGNFGKTTRMYTNFLQGRFNLGSDGFVGKKTRAALTDWCMKNYNAGGAIGSDNPYVKRVSLGDEFTVRPSSSFIINDTSIVVSVSQIYGNKCSANAPLGPGVACTMEYNPAIRFSGMFGGDVSMSFTPQILYVGETSNFSLSGFADKTDATLKLVSVSDDGTSVKLKLEKK
jgi:hypothetical protein